jgi:hypothetical protein
MRRVVRTTRGTFKRDSICARCLLTAGVEMPSSRAAALKLPVLASVEKNAKSAGCTAARGVTIVGRHFLLKQGFVHLGLNLGLTML